MVRFSNLKGLYDIEKTIGCGGFAKVKLATHVATGEKVAIKIMEKNALGDDLPRVKLELKALQTLTHQHICKLYQVIETDTHFFLAIEYCSGGELFDHIVEKNRLTESESRMFFRQIVSAVAYLHSLGYAHRDLKPENVLLDHEQTLKLIDFGLCARPEGGIASPLFTSCGSPTYAAPELVMGKKYYGPEVDIWSLGVLLFALLAGFLPFDDQSIDSLYKKILSGKYDEPSWMSSESRKLIRSMLQINPKKRITVTQLLSHPWLTMGVLEPVDYRAECERHRDDECVELMARQRRVSSDEMWRRLELWRYDYDTATYLLLLARKKRGLPLKLNLCGARGQFRNKLCSLENDTLSTTERRSRGASSPGLRFNPATPLPPKTPDNPKTVPVDATAAEAATPTSGDFLQPPRPSTIRKPLKRLRSPNPDGECSPIPAKQRATPSKTTPKTPTYERRRTPGSDTPGSARKVLGSLERSLHKVRHVLTPGRRPHETPAQPHTLTTKNMCNVSTTGFRDPESAMAELSRTLQERGVSCTRKGFRLRGKTEPGALGGGSCSFELEFCLLPDMGSDASSTGSEDAVSGGERGRVGIRRKRLKGDSWCYKRVCEQVLAMASRPVVSGLESEV